MGAISGASLQGIPKSYATCSIGCRESDTLPRKLEAIKKAGFTGIELSFPDILGYGGQILGHSIQPKNTTELRKVCSDIQKLCDKNGLKIMMLQPFANFEGWPVGSAEREDAFERATVWIELMKVLGTDLLQVGSTDSPKEKISDDRDTIVTDLRELADLLAQNGFRLAYENWCWSTHAPHWKDVWEIVEAVDRPNIGLCLDTFQSCGSEWADPTTSSGLIEGLSSAELSKKFSDSLHQLAQKVPGDKIYLLQISDAYKVSPPLEDKVVDGLRPRGRWSHDYRPMPYDGGYLPIEDFAKAVLQTGFRGWFSVEIFDQGQDGKGIEYEMDSYAQKAMRSLDKLLQNCATE
ncbi:hypothetical protein N7468_008860 [Penicillium chermesinum]|uniref:Xylose isomerase-like TIM barrel domain-containing protein n=1 Tax=Penicillium chermesinum TaxID=63820 RepID=A0A9W9NGW7_9EURO|nr:uncharacterized protein N7468_008860 [Penicillium chermesinum]KAJ5219656.1 hypothetical protein N7468_008860 [Penicillium chermesinum]KAJ6153660.1 hypothetical protein N7470_006619 [Penicillium chermesinum]